jgi:hypothetical protein
VVAVLGVEVLVVAQEAAVRAVVAVHMYNDYL